jgi:hypothetical protein
MFLSHPGEDGAASCPEFMVKAANLLTFKWQRNFEALMGDNY